MLLALLSPMILLLQLSNGYLEIVLRIFKIIHSFNRLAVIVTWLICSVFSVCSVGHVITRRKSRIFAGRVREEKRGEDTYYC